MLALLPLVSVATLRTMFMDWLGIGAPPVELLPEDAGDHRVASAAASSSPAASQKLVRWVHMPKTGTSFANTIFRHGCRGVDDVTSVSGDSYPIAEFTQKYDAKVHCADGLLNPGHLDGHYPAVDPKDGEIVTVVREPVEHKHSLLEFTLQEMRLFLPDHPHEVDSFWRSNGWSDVDEVHRTLVPAALARGPTHPDRCPWLVQLLPRLSGCQSKMTVFSQSCLEDPTAAQAAIAAERARVVSARARELFAFVGLTSAFNETVCSFHQTMAPHLSTYGDGKQPLPNQFAHTRVTNHSEVDWAAQARSCSGGEQLLRLLEHDPADEALHKMATEVFHSQLAALRDVPERASRYDACVAKNQGTRMMMD
jgi:hypothetical protein